MWLINNLGFNAIWFSAIFFENSALPFGILLLAIHCWYFRKSNEITTVALVMVLGTIIDTGLMYLEVFSFKEQTLFIPAWLMLIWAAFGATLNHSLGILKERKILTLAIGFVFPPLSYLAGHKFEAVSFGYSTGITLAILAVIWAPLLYGLFRISYVKHQPQLA